MSRKPNKKSGSYYEEKEFVLWKMNHLITNASRTKKFIYCICCFLGDHFRDTDKISIIRLSKMFVSRTRHENDHEVVTNTSRRYPIMTPDIFSFLPNYIQNITLRLGYLKQKKYKISQHIRQKWTSLSSRGKKSEHQKWLKWAKMAIIQWVKKISYSTYSRR